MINKDGVTSIYNYFCGVFGQGNVQSDKDGNKYTKDFSLLLTHRKQ